jgi:hypothetical protein
MNYKYTLLKQDGTTEDLGTGAKKDFKELYKILNCSLIQIIPDEYYDGWIDGEVECYGDEEGRYNSENIRNPHFKVLKGNPAMGEVAEWDIVGNIVREELIK